jgi:hypothetical protein
VLSSQNFAEVVVVYAQGDLGSRSFPEPTSSSRFDLEYQTKFVRQETPPPIGGAGQAPGRYQHGPHLQSCAGTLLLHHAHQSHFGHCLQSVPFGEKPQTSESDHDASYPTHSRANRHGRHAKPRHQCFVPSPLTRKTSLDKNWRCGSIEWLHRLVTLFCVCQESFCTEAFLL